MATGRQPRPQSSLGYCVAEVERETFGPLGPRATLGMGDPNVKHPTDPGGASRFVTSAKSDMSTERSAPSQPPRLERWWDGDADSRMPAATFSNHLTATRRPSDSFTHGAQPEGAWLASDTTTQYSGMTATQSAIGGNLESAPAGVAAPEGRASQSMF